MNRRKQLCSFSMFVYEPGRPHIYWRFSMANQLGRLARILRLSIWRGRCYNYLLPRVRVISTISNKPCVVIRMSSWNRISRLRRSVKDNNFIIIGATLTFVRRCVQNNWKESERCVIAARKGKQLLGMTKINITYREKHLLMVIPFYKSIVRPRLQ